MGEHHLAPAGLVLQPELGPAVHAHGDVGAAVAVEVGDHDVLDVFEALADEVLGELVPPPRFSHQTAIPAASLVGALPSRVTTSRSPSPSRSASFRSSARGYRSVPAKPTSVERFQSGAEDLERRVALLDRHEVVVAVAVDVADVPLVGDVGVVEDDAAELRVLRRRRGREGREHEQGCDQGTASEGRHGSIPRDRRDDAGVDRRA